MNCDQVIVKNDKEIKYDSLSTKKKVVLASALANLMYKDFTLRRSQVSDAANLELLSLEVSDGFGKDLSGYGPFDLFLDQPSGFPNLSIKEFLSSCDTYTILSKESFANTNPHRALTFSPMLSLSVSLFLLRTIVNDEAEFPNYPEVYPQLLMLATIPEIPHSYQAYLMSFLTKIDFHLKNVEFNKTSRIVKALIISAINSKDELKRILTSEEFFGAYLKERAPEVSSRFKMLADGQGALKLKIIVPIAGKEANLMFLPPNKKYLLELPHSSCIAQIDKSALDKEQEKYAYGQYFIIKRRPSFLVIREASLGSDLKSTCELLKRKSSLLVNFLFVNGIALYEIADD